MTTIIMPPAKKTYTLIDNFDKFDIDTYWDNASSGEVYQELFAATTQQGLGGAGQIIEINYKRPLAYNFEIRPDLIRFLTGRRFYLDQYKALQYVPGSPPLPNSPNLWEKDIYINPTENFPASPQEGDNFLIDIAGGIDTKLDRNFTLLQSRIGFAQYFVNPQPGEFIPNQGQYAFYGIDLSNLITYSQLNCPGTDIHADGCFGDADPTLMLEKFKTVLNNADYSGKFVVNMFLPKAGAFWVNHDILWLWAKGYNGRVEYIFTKKPDSTAMTPWLKGDDPTPDPYSPLNFVNRLLTYRYRVTSNISSNPVDEITNPNYLYFVSDHSIGHKYAPTGIEGYGVDPHLVEIKPYYNYYSQQAENYDPNIITNERQLPNIYTFYAYKTSKTNASYYGDLIKPGGMSATPPKKFKIVNYYEETNTGMAGDTEIANKYKTVVFGKDLNILKDVQTLKSHFPYGVEIALPSAHDSPIMNLFNEADLVDITMSMLANYTLATDTISSDIHRFIVQRDHTDLSMADLQFFDWESFLGTTELYEHLNSNAFASFEEYGKFFFDDNDVKFGKILKDTGGFAPDFFSPKFWPISAQIGNYFKDKVMRIEDIYEGKKCHTEIIAYEIAKYRVETPTEGANPLENTHVQSIFIPNISQADEYFSYLDTQVFAGVQYVYEIFAHTMVVGQRYKMGFPRAPIPDQPGFMKGAYEGKDGDGVPRYLYKLPWAWDDANPVTVDPYGIIVRAPYYNTATLTKGSRATTTIIDKPPLPPDITFHPYKDVDNKILVMLTQNMGTLILPPIALFPEDNEKIQSYFQAQKGENKPGSKIIYKSDDGQGGSWHIFRTMHQPDDPTDLYWRFRIGQAQERVINMETQSGYEDTLLKNTDYYYVARFVDIHGNFSNPTAVFRVRIVKEEGFPPYLIIDTYNFSEDQYKMVTSIPFKKFIKIRLKDNLRQIKGGSALTPDITYQSQFGDVLRKYKFRITSQKTGKRIDINVGFGQEIIKPTWTPPVTIDGTGQEGDSQVVDNLDIGDPPPLPIELDELPLGDISFPDDDGGFGI